MGGSINCAAGAGPDAVNLNVIATTIWDWHGNSSNKLYRRRGRPRRTGGASVGHGHYLGVVNLNEKQRTDSYMTFERGCSRTSARVTGMRARANNMRCRISREVSTFRSRADPGPDSRPGTADDTGQSITYYDYPTSLRGAAYAKTMIINSSAAESNYKTFEIAVMKRPAQGWQLGTSFSSTWVNVPSSCGSNGSGLGSGIPLIWYPNRCLTNPNQLFNTANKTREWQVKLSGAYNLPYGILASANYDIRNGSRVARQVLFTGGQSIRSISLNVEPIGTFSFPRTHELDVRAAKRVGLGGARALEFRFDIYNALNKGTVTNMTLQSGANYLRPSAVLFPRILQIGATFTF